jgi:hypothetical protein
MEDLTPYMTMASALQALIKGLQENAERTPDQQASSAPPRKAGEGGRELLDRRATLRTVTPSRSTRLPIPGQLTAGVELDGSLGVEECRSPEDCHPPGLRRRACRRRADALDVFRAQEALTQAGILEPRPYTLDHLKRIFVSLAGVVGTALGPA